MINCTFPATWGFNLQKKHNSKGLQENWWLGRLLSLFLVTPPKLNIAPVKIDGNVRLLSFWDGVVSGAMSNFQGLVFGAADKLHPWKRTIIFQPFLKTGYVNSAVRRGYQTSPLWLEKIRHWSSGIEPISTNSIKPMLPVITISKCYSFVQIATNRKRRSPNNIPKMILHMKPPRFLGCYRWLTSYTDVASKPRTLSGEYSQHLTR